MPPRRPAPGSAGGTPTPAGHRPLRSEVGFGARVGAPGPDGPGGDHRVTSQRVIRSGTGAHVLRADFCFEQARLVVETDGSRWHPDGKLDRLKDNALAGAGWRVLRFTWSQVMDGHEAVLEQIRTALAPGCTQFDRERAAAA
ncbi:MAG: endonuclease domain-containing protein [Frankiaceae bacterium]|nr:endonuclease domain-containing protein [Frankiaceae bacterium]